MHLLKSKLKDWLDSETVEFLKVALERELKNIYQERADTFISGEPDKTHEIRSNLIGQEAVIQDMLDILGLKGEALERYFDLNGVHIVDDTKETEVEE